MNNIIEFKGCDYPTHFGWELTNTCQYRCKYCYFLKSLKNNIARDYIDNYKNVLTKLKLKRIGNFNMELLGGEPTDHPDLNIILDELCRNPNCNEIELVTNMTKPVGWFCDLYKRYNKVRISVSYHVMYDKNNSILHKYKSLHDSLNGDRTIININMIPEEEYYDKLLSAANFLDEHGISYRCNFIHQVKDVYASEYDDNFYNVFEDVLNRCSNPVYTYTTDDGKQHTVKEHVVRKNKIYQFYNKYTCTPTMWYIDHSGRFFNYCTGEELDILCTNIKNETVCPVERGCKDCNLLLNYSKKVIK